MLDKPTPPLVNERYLRNIRGNFAEVVRGHIDALTAKPSWQNNEKARFFEWLLTQVTSDEYEDIKRRYPMPEVPTSGMFKYLDPIAWFEQKFAYAFLLRIHEGPRNETGPRKRILDIGSGASHFLTICRYYGHDAIGTEIPDHKDEKRPTHLYNALADLYKTTRMKHRLVPMQDFPELPPNLDLVTSFSVAFNRYRGKMWTIGEWDFFLSQIRRHIKPGGELFLMLVQNKVTPDIWEHLAAKAEWSDPKRYQLSVRMPS